jgi:hypothetical protein
VIGNRAAYDRAIDYLKQDPGMAAVIKSLEDSWFTYYVVTNNVTDDSYQPGNGTVHWDPFAAVTLASGDTMSPALALGHELAHADGNELLGMLRSLVPWGAYDNYEEYRVIRDYEWSAATTLGEGYRFDHSGGTYYRVTDPTARN